MTRRLLAPLLAVLVLLTACGTPDVVRWNGLLVDLPEGWVVHEEDTTRFSITDAPLGTEGEVGPGRVGAFFTVERSTTAADWRDLIEQEGWVLEVDEDITISGSPATRLVFTHGPDALTPTREMVVVLPSRDVVILFQPAVLLGATDGPQVFDAFRADFEAILDGIVLGAPE